MNVLAFVHLVLDEVRRSVRAQWVLAAFIVFCGSGWMAVRLGQRDLQEQQRVFADQLQARLQVQLRHPTRATGRGPEPGLRALRSPNASAVLVQGHDRTLPAAWEMTPAGVEALSPYASVGRTLEGGGTWDLEILVRVLGGLLALGLGLSGVIRDRAGGWVRVLATSPIGPRLSNLARLLGGSLVLAGFATAWWMTIGLSLVVGHRGSTISVGRLLVLLPCAIVYFWIFLGIGAVCAWRARGAFQAVFWAVTAWLATAVLGPALIGLAAEIVQPLPAPAHFEQARREQYADNLRAIDQAIAKQASASILPTMSPPEQERLVDAQLRALDGPWQAELLRARRAMIDVETQWRMQGQARRRFMAALRWLSPGSLLREALSELAGTGANHSQSWEDATGRYQTDLNRSLFDDRPATTLRIPVGEAGFVHTQIRHPAPRYGDLPQFEDPEWSWRDRSAAAGPSLIGLACWLLATTSAAWAFGARGDDRPAYGVEV